MENNMYNPFDKEPLAEVGKIRLAEYKAIRPFFYCDK